MTVCSKVCTCIVSLSGSPESQGSPTEELAYVDMMGHSLARSHSTHINHYQGHHGNHFQGNTLPINESYSTVTTLAMHGGHGNVLARQLSNGSAMLATSYRSNSIPRNSVISDSPSWTSQVGSYGGSHAGSHTGSWEPRMSGGSTTLPPRPHHTILEGRFDCVIIKNYSIKV